MSSTNQTTETGGRTGAGSPPRPMATIHMKYDADQDRWIGELCDPDGIPIEKCRRADMSAALDELVEAHAIRHGREYPGEITMELFA